MYQPYRSRSKSAARQRAVDGLTAVYAELTLPRALRPEELPSGERQMLIEKDVLQFVEDLYRSESPEQNE